MIFVPQDKVPRDCDNHKAARDMFVRFLGVDVSGVGAVTCARHSCFMPRGMVDFFRGERYAYSFTDCRVQAYSSFLLFPKLGESYSLLFGYPMLIKDT